MKKKVLCLLPSTVGHPDYCPRHSNRPSPHRFSDFQFSFFPFILHPSSLPPDSQRRCGGGAALRGVAVYEEFIEGAKEGIQVALRIFPYLVAMRRERQALAAGLLADAAGVAASLVICRLNFK